MPKFSYAIHYNKLDHYSSEDGPGWEPLWPYKDVQRTWAEGWLANERERPGPRLALRLVRSDGRVIDEVRGSAEASMGMIAGMPQWDDYARAGLRALERAVQCFNFGALARQRARERGDGESAMEQETREAVFAVTATLREKLDAFYEWRRQGIEAQDRIMRDQLGGPHEEEADSAGTPRQRDA